MTIIIDEPRMASQLKLEAALRGMAPGDYVRRILEQHLPLAPKEGSNGVTPPDDWNLAFNGWVNGHMRREPLPPEAFARESFYREPT